MHCDTCCPLPHVHQDLSQRRTKETPVSRSSSITSVNGQKHFQCRGQTLSLWPDVFLNVFTGKMFRLWKYTLSKKLYVLSKSSNVENPPCLFCLSICFALVVSVSVCGAVSCSGVCLKTQQQCLFAEIIRLHLTGGGTTLCTTTRKEVCSILFFYDWHRQCGKSTLSQQLISPKRHRC